MSAAPQHPLNSPKDSTSAFTAVGRSLIVRPVSPEFLTFDRLGNIMEQLNPRHRPVDIGVEYARLCLEAATVVASNLHVKTTILYRLEFGAVMISGAAREFLDKCRLKRLDIEKSMGCRMPNLIVQTIPRVTE